MRIAILRFIALFPSISGAGAGPDVDIRIIGVSLSEPHINGTSLPALYIYLFIYIFIYVVRPSREMYAQHGSMDISAKYSIAHCLAEPRAVYRLF
jgi:hypothetical protein